MSLSIKEFTARKKGQLFEFLPKKAHALDFEPILEKMRRASMVITVESSDFIIVRFQKAKITLFKSGKANVENVKTTVSAKKIFAKFLEKTG